MNKTTHESFARSARIAAERIEHRIHVIRGQKVMLDSDLAELYGVLTKVLNRAVIRNRDRFPADFMFRITRQEAQILRCQFGTSSLEGRIGFRKETARQDAAPRTLRLTKDR